MKYELALKSQNRPEKPKPKEPNCKSYKIKGSISIQKRNPVIWRATRRLMFSVGKRLPPQCSNKELPETLS